ncbi:DNA photolyase [Lophium mytilinum]|uniref:DNA photolyase n=1 Tax=Lophium mytilinum TaxID=390894 RepID=A0A6A6QV79_9PEZI|nr:DNA photolyase [Lophium mytilinum]
MAIKPRVIYWFRTDLRLHDSPALAAALDLKPECLWPIWCWDPHYVYRARVGPNRWQYLLDCQQDLSDSIARLNPKSRLHVLREAPQTLLPKLFKAWKVTHLVFEKDTDAYARSRDEEVMSSAREAGVQVIVKYGKTLWDPDAVVKANGNKPTMTISQLRHAGEKVGDIPRPIPAPKSIPDPGNMPLDFAQTQPAPEPDLNSIYRTRKENSYEKLAGPNGDFAVPTIEELGIKSATTPHRGGETGALAVLDNIIKNEQYTATFEKPKSAPTAFEPQSTTLLSPHLHFGSLSCREFYWRVQDVVDNFKGKASQPPVSLTGQLLFRDMYFAAQAKMGWKFSQTVGNDHCRFIPWHLRSKVDGPDGLVTGEYNIDSVEAEEWFQRWKTGRTGFPWIDAVMRQLKQEGWIHHLARHSVACFLTRGGCYIDWERGAEVFEEWLIDHETACNTGNWQWLSCTAFFSQFYRCYSPIAFPQKTDKNGDFVRHFVPELKDFPAKYIYEPWKAPIQDQRTAKCIIKGDGTVQTIDELPAYPKPMFDFSTRRDICIGGMKNAYRVGLYGNSPKVVNGSWPSAFDDDAEGTTDGKNISEQDTLEVETHRQIQTDTNSKADSLKPMNKNKRKGTGTLEGFLRPQKAMK